MLCRGTYWKNCADILETQKTRCHHPQNPRSRQKAKRDDSQNKTCENFWIAEFNNHLLDALNKVCNTRKAFAENPLPLKKNNLNLNKCSLRILKPVLIQHRPSQFMILERGPKLCSLASVIFHQQIPLALFVLSLSVSFCISSFLFLNCCVNFSAVFFPLQSWKILFQFQQIPFQGLSGGLILALDVCSLNFKKYIFY